MPTSPPPARDVADLVALVARLRAADGCPWDRRQTLADVRAYLVEEAHELAAAIDAGDWVSLREELGDLLFQAAFIARLAEEETNFTLHEAVATIHDKMVERHPHVFGEAVAATAEDVQRAWEQRKARKREAGGHLDGVATTLPALVAAYRLGQKAGGVGFDWSRREDVAAKVREELDEVLATTDVEAAREEVGDLLFAAASLARHFGVDPEGALARANDKFRRRFRTLERDLEVAGRPLGTATPAEMEAAWERVKAGERDPEAGHRG